MSGSGASVFVPVADAEQGRRIRSRIASAGIGQCLVVGSLTRHPLREWAFPQAGVEGREIGRERFERDVPDTGAS
jgi:hypothetical protein